MLNVKTTDFICELANKLLQLLYEGSSAQLWRGKVQKKKIFNFEVGGISLRTSGKRMDERKWSVGDYDISLVELMVLDCNLLLVHPIH